MAFRVGAQVKLWRIENKGNYSSVQISTSKKNKQTDTYETDFSGIVRFIGHAHNKLSQVKVNDRVKIGDCEVTNKYDKEKKITYTNYAVFDFELENSNNNTPPPAVDTSADDDSPFN